MFLLTDWGTGRTGWFCSLTSDPATPFLLKLVEPSTNPVGRCIFGRAVLFPGTDAAPTQITLGFLTRLLTGPWAAEVPKASASKALLQPAFKTLERSMWPQLTDGSSWVSTFDSDGQVHIPSLSLASREAQTELH